MKWQTQRPQKKLLQGRKLGEVKDKVSTFKSQPVKESAHASVAAAELDHKVAGLCKFTCHFFKTAKMIGMMDEVAATLRITPKGARLADTRFCNRLAPPLGPILSLL